MKFNFFISCVCSLFFSICFLNNLFSVPYSVPVPACWRSEYYVHCDFTGPRHWNEHSGGKVECRGTTYRHGLNPIVFSFHRNKSSWEDFLNDNNTFDECFLEDAYEYLQYKCPCANQAAVYSNISSINWKTKGDLKIPFIEGSWFQPGSCEAGFFRLYTFPTIDNKSTYYLCINIKLPIFCTEAQPHNKSHNATFSIEWCEKWYDQIFRFINKRNVTRRNKDQCAS